MSFVVGQVPNNPLLVTVRDAQRKRVNLSGYDSAELLLTNPDGSAVATSAGVGAITPEGDFRYAFPVSTLFLTPGDYLVRLRCTKGTAVDYTEPQRLEVRRP